MRLVTSSDNKLKKPTTPHLDIALLGLLVGLSSLFGLPWMVGALVPSINHLRSLAKIDTSGERQRLHSILETRISGIGIYISIGATLFFLPLLGGSTAPTK